MIEFLVTNVLFWCVVVTASAIFSLWEWSDCGEQNPHLFRLVAVLGLMCSSMMLGAAMRGAQLLTFAP